MTSNPASETLTKARRLVAASGMTYQQIGERMGYPAASARMSVSQFLNGKNPSLAMLKRFAKALNVDIKEIL